MGRYNKKNYKKYIVLFVLLLLIGTGYAFLSKTLNLNGISSFGELTWDIYFENSNLTQGNTVEGASAPEAPSASKLKNLNYEVYFTEPEQVYEFTVDIKNAGSIAAKVHGLDTSIKVGNGAEFDILADKSNLPGFLKYDITEVNGDALTYPFEMAGKSKKTIKVRVSFDPDTPDELENGAGETFALNMSLDVSQKTSQKGDRTVKTWDTNPVVDESIQLVNNARYYDEQYVYTYIAPGTYDFYGYNPFTGSYGPGYASFGVIYSAATPTVSTTGGWHVSLKDRDSYDPVTEELRTSINGEPIISMYATFFDSRAESIDLSSFYTGNVIDMRDMFDGTRAQTLDVSSFDTSKVISMSHMFEGAYATEIIGLDKFNTKNVTNMGHMFLGSSCTTLDLSSFNTKKVIDFAYMFAGTYSYVPPITTIYVSNKFVTTSVGSGLCENGPVWSADCDENVFGNCTHLVGGNGTTYSSSRNSLTYARIDKSGKLGYFTLKS